METVIIDTEGMLDEINMDPEDESEEVAQIIATILGTPRGSVPLERDIGLEMRYLHANQDVAAAQMEAELAAALDDWEPRASMETMTCKRTDTGQMVTKAKVILNGG